MQDKVQKTAPEIRFKGYTDAWVQRKLGNVVEKVKSYSITRSEEVSFGRSKTRYIHYGDIHTGIADKISNSSKIPFIQDKEYINLKNGDVVLADASEDYKEIAMPSIILEKGDLNLVAGLHTIALRPISVEPIYLYYVIKSQRFRKFGYKVGTGLKVFGISSKNVLNFDGFFSTYGEQKSIGNLLKNLDDLLALQQRKLDVLKELKKALLQQMFPEKGKDIPNLRFANFTDSWVERQLLNLFTKGGSGGTPKSTNKEFYTGTIPFLSISDVTNSNGIIFDTEKHITQEALDSSSAWLVPKESISLAMYASVGKLTVIKNDMSTSQAFYNMVFDDNYIRDFVYHRLNKSLEFSEWNKLISTGTQANLNAQKVKSFILKKPVNYTEIKEITKMLNKFDQLINISELKLDGFKSFKKALLQKMFI